ncbi:carboxypeptidase Taq [Haloplanus vescus]|uniref:Metal-dependent carboxypeptidase n=1 Tax=Haloplanus vescus TaxID=555874 RepID=A0A1H4AHJ9_9EURY|nr:carboxypeptidase M32 [Haloplanus vescus]SEA35228.1 carboxypeptidase Taq [Haloplanus vescus]
MSDATDAYDDLLDHVGRLTNVSKAREVLSWDQQVMMPEGGTPARSQQLSTLSAVHHDLLTDDELGRLLDDLSESSLEDDRAAVVREVRREQERAVCVPTDLVERISAASSEALTAWREAKSADDFETFAPHLEELVDLKRRYAEHVDPDRDPYEVLFEEYEPCLPLSHAEDVLTTLRDAVVPLVDDIRASDADLATDAFTAHGPFDTESQEALMRTALDRLGYPWERGRLDIAPHPFSTGTQFDARVTTRYDEADPIGALLSTVHEFGHATYTLGLPDDAYGTPLGEARDLSIHESQSRLWENHVGRSTAFWEGFLPAVVDAFPGVDDVSPREAYEAVNAVDPTNLIRVEADELTYHLHIVLRFEIERDLIRGDLDVSEVPAVWNDKMESYLGVRPETDAEGCLQDIHWSHGNFGYFPTYSLGSVVAAQLFDAAADDIKGLDDQIRAGEFDSLHEWLTENIHRHGKRYETNELVRRATGEGVSADAFVDYATAKYGDLYEL